MEFLLLHAMEWQRVVGSYKIGLFCKKYRSLLWGSFAKDAQSLKEDTNRCHPTEFCVERERETRTQICNTRTLMRHLCVMFDMW